MTHTKDTIDIIYESTEFEGIPVPSRSRHVEADYQYYLLRNGHISPENLILADVFSETGDYQLPQQVAISRNRYSYTWPNDYLHMILWVRWDEQVKMNSEQCKDYILATYRPDSVVAIWQNRPDQQTVKGIRHYHFLVKY